MSGGQRCKCGLLVETKCGICYLLMHGFVNPNPETIDVDFDFVGDEGTFGAIHVKVELCRNIDALSAGLT